MTYTKFMLCAGLLTTGTTAMAQLVERPESVGADSSYVPVSLNALANDHSTLSVPGQAITFDKIPFDLASKAANNNLFLHNAGWPDWQEDPLKFYSVYDGKPKEPTDTLPIVQVPVDDYSAIYVLASCENDPKYSNILSFRIGIKDAGKQTTYRDFEFEVPRRNQKNGPYVVKALPAPNQGVFLLRLPINAALAQDFRHHRMLDVEITKKLRLSVTKPDAARFQYRPLGLPSGVRIYGMTFERSPLKLSLQGSEIGNVFNQPQTPEFSLRLDQMDARRLRDVVIRAKAVDYYGNETEFPAISVAKLPMFQTNLKLPVTRKGYYHLTVQVEENKKILLERKTTFAVLPKDTRSHRAQSPFGVWDFGGTHYTPNNADVVGSLYVKAGLRYGMFNFTPEERKRYGIIKGNDPKVNARTDLSKLDDQIAAIKATGETPQRWLLFHEDAISGDHITRTPDLFTGRKYEMNAEEKAKFDKMVDIIRETVPKVRKAFPGIQFDLGNGNPHLMEEFLRHKLPKELFDALGNEAASFQRLPESQPLDFVANNASMWMQREILNKYGYGDKKLVQSYEVMYPSSNPGNLTLSQQASYVVRNAMHSLAWKIPVIRFEGIADPGNSYYHSNWGGTGLMFAQPDVSPKPLFVAVATMTQQLDGAKFMRIVPTGTTTVYAFEFKKPNGLFVTCLWTPNVARYVRFLGAQNEFVVTDLMANTKTFSPLHGRLVIPARAEPVFIESQKPLQIVADTVIENAAPATENFIVSSLADAAQWEVEEGKDSELEAFNFMQPRRQGEFEVREVESFEGRSGVLEVKPVATDDKQWWLPHYIRLRLKNPVEISGNPTHIGLQVNGNGGWGRIVFELEDAAGQRWVSLGTEQKGKLNPWLGDWLGDAAAKSDRSGVSDWNANDVWGRSMINFAGWNYLQFPLPGNYPGEGYHWPYTSQWRCVKPDGTAGDYIVHYPLKMTRLAVTARSKVLYGTQVQPVRRPEIYLKDLQVTYGDPDTVFWKPDLGQR